MPFHKVDLRATFIPRDLISNHAPNAGLVPKKKNADATSSSKAWEVKNFPTTDAKEKLKDAIVETDGFEPRERESNGSYEDKISDTGVEERHPKENVRASQGKDPKEQFLDWDGKT